MSAAVVAEPEAGAPGNWLAHEIRRFQENSQGLFPTPKPGEHRTRFNTIYDIEYIPLDKEKAETPLALHHPAVKKETPFSLQQAKRFNTWKIKKDLVEFDKVQQRVAERRRTAQDAARQSELPSNFPKIERGHSIAHDGQRSRSKAQSVADPHYSESIPSSALRLANQTEAVRMSAPAAVERESRSRLKNIKKDLLAAAEDYMVKAPHADRRVVDKALEASNRHFREDERELRKTLPDTKKEAEKWLESANDHEQELALRFFRSVSGMRLMGLGNKAEQTERLQRLLSTLETGEAKAPVPRMTYETEQRIRARKQRNLQFAKKGSSSPDSRESYQSWHHLPTYRPFNRVDNVRSHFTQPQKVKPLHFTIHPDWGP